MPPPKAPNGASTIASIPKQDHPQHQVHQPGPGARYRTGQPQVDLDALRGFYPAQIVDRLWNHS